MGSESFLNEYLIFFPEKKYKTDSSGVFFPEFYLNFWMVFRWNWKIAFTFHSLQPVQNLHFMISSESLSLEPASSVKMCEKIK